MNPHEQGGQIMPDKVTNRWLIAGAGVVMQVALGAVYAWSVFRKPLSEEFDASVSSVNIAFTPCSLITRQNAPASGVPTGLPS